MEVFSRKKDLRANLGGSGELFPQRESSAGFSPGAQEKRGFEHLPQGGNYSTLSVEFGDSPTGYYTPGVVSSNTNVCGYGKRVKRRPCSL